MLSASVSNLDLFRTWRGEEDLDLQWLLSRLADGERTEPMIVGDAFHAAIEKLPVSEVDDISAKGYTFSFLCECQIEFCDRPEMSVAKQYGDLTVRGRVDVPQGRVITDYKTTSQFDADRLMFGYQWRFYLDMMDADVFRWEVFILKETDDPKVYVVSDHHTLEQRRYPDMHDDCLKLASEYMEFAKQYLVPQAV